MAIRAVSQYARAVVPYASRTRLQRTRLHRGKRAMSDLRTAQPIIIRQHLQATCANRSHARLTTPAVRSRSWLTGWLLAAAIVWLGFTPSLSAADNTLSWSLRSQTETAADSGRYHTVEQSEQWQAGQTAVIVCDMWDLHHCLNATRRGQELAPRMNEFLKKARQQGVTIIHAPSSCMEFYQDHPARKRAQAVPRAAQLPEEIGAWCHQIPSEQDGEYPIDQSDGGEDDDPDEHARWAQKLKDMGRNPGSPWKRQTAALEIDPQQDYISDSGEEIWSVLESRNISNVMLVGVHTNMCVLGRPFGLRQMARNGKHVVLVRDLTDTMYNPLRKPYVSHFTGTDLIVSHIERHVCPTVTSDQLLGGKPFRFEKDVRPTVLVVIAEREYRTNETLPPFAISELGKQFRVEFVFANEQERNDLPGIERLEQADCLLLSVRRRVLPTAQMDLIRKYLQSGKPIVGIRTANHAFLLRKQAPPEGFADWQTWDHDVFGGSYSNHYGTGPKVQVSIAEGASDQPILKGVDTSQLAGFGSLYQVAPLAKGTNALLMGKIEGKPAEPIAWTYRHLGGGKSFYTSLGHIDDFQQPQFRRLLRQAVCWAAGMIPRDQVAPGY